jgi:benzil reductase ((S)-benzoin forming)
MKNVALVTGTSRGIGLALAHRLLELDWSVVGLARGSAPLDHPEYRHLLADLSDMSALEELVREEVSPLLQGGGLECFGLVNNAALIGALARLQDSEAAALAHILAVNAAAPIFLTGWVVKHAPASVSLRIANISSAAAHTPLPGLGDYSATKAALLLAGRIQAAELEADGYTPERAAIFSYEPGLVDTHMQDAARDSDPDRFPAHGTFSDFADQGLLNAPAEVVAPVVDFLNSSPSEFFREARHGE